MAESPQVRNAGRRELTRETANVFADLRFPDAVERQVGAVKVLGITQPQGAALHRHQLADSLSNA